jgi:hypothetical protein
MATFVLIQQHEHIKCTGNDISVAEAAIALSLAGCSVL